MYSINDKLSYYSKRIKDQSLSPGQRSHAYKKVQEMKRKTEVKNYSFYACNQNNDQFKVVVEGKTKSEALALARKELNHRVYQYNGRIFVWDKEAKNDLKVGYIVKGNMDHCIANDKIYKPDPHYEGT